MNLYHEILYRPLLNLLIWLYNVLPGADIGFAILMVTVLVKAALWPLTHASLKANKAMQSIQPKIEALKVQYKDDKEALTKAMMELYTTEKVNPLSSCLPILVQLPLLIALYQVLRAGLHAESLNDLYSFVHKPETINAFFVGLIDLSKRSIPLAILAGGLQFLQTHMMMRKRVPPQVKKTEGAKDEEMLIAMNRSMLYVMPLMTVFIGWSIPGGLTLYWVAVNAITILQQWIINTPKKPTVAKTV